MSKQAASTIDEATDIIGMLKEDHKRLKDLFEQFQHTDDSEEREQIIRNALQELEIHAEIEEKILYPEFRKHIEEEELMDEALEEHHVAHFLLKELKGRRGAQGRRDAKFIVLGESVKHHIREEEESMLPEIESADLDWEALSRQVIKKRSQLESRRGRAAR